MHIFPLKIIFVLTFGAMLAGCSVNNLGIPADRVAKIRPGSTASMVRDSLGEPQNLQFSGKQEAWQYCRDRDPWKGGKHRYTVVWFVDGNVSGLTTYNHFEFGIIDCTLSFKTVSWEDSPDKVVEIRDR